MCNKRVRKQVEIYCAFSTYNVIKINNSSFRSFDIKFYSFFACLHSNQFSYTMHTFLIDIRSASKRYGKYNYVIYSF